MFNYNDDIMGQYRRSRILNPTALRQSQSSFQRTPPFDDENDNSDDSDSSGEESTSANMTAAENEVNQRGGMFYNRENMQKYIDAMQRLDDSPRPRLEALSAHLDNQPTREKYEPTKGNRFGAALAGFGTGYVEGPSRGMAAARETLDRPYNSARQDWMDKTGPLEYGANLEEKDRASKMASLQRGATLGINYDKADLERQKFDQAKKEAGVRMDNIRSQIADRNSGIQGTKEGDNGNLLLVRKDGTIEDTGVKTLEYTRYLQTKKRNDEQTRIGEENATTGRRNATTAEGQLRVSWQNATTSAAAQKLREKQDEEGRPSQMATARQIATDELRTYPAFSTFVDVTDRGKSLIKPFDPNTMDWELYKGFMDEIDRRAQIYTTGKTNANPSRIPRDRNR
jgi:hypothetical protein